MRKSHFIGKWWCRPCEAKQKSLAFEDGASWASHVQTTHGIGHKHELFLHIEEASKEENALLQCPLCPQKMDSFCFSKAICVQDTSETHNPHAKLLDHIANHIRTFAFDSLPENEI